ncbi:LysM peptidoglycan-binding domain-containing protein [Lapillicoccus jejuensis]|uniref:LysM domain-containing protein n=1 Tax=Lapillicoccus jejuensis TaxID=402171 RepID=A0A542DVV5_9MICO|nr:LysM peptidoglycan-binding domain-containing protein [Lapillicoccus jejuensis]TQJ07044.1 hypothetical protein FB458_0090 [Lapillicoccus jejuensis]
MSAAAVWSVAPATDLVGAPSRRPELRLVPTGRAARAASAPLRITRFGRLLVLASAVTLGVVLLVSVLGAGSAAATIDHTVTVSSGQTLSQVAAHELPGLPVDEGVAQIQLANGLSSLQVHAGQRLAIPALP